MSSLVSYAVGGALVVLAMDAVVPSVGLGVPVSQWPSLPAADGPQIVNRTDKQDRLPMPIANRPTAPQLPHHVLVGCEPVFSPLSASARLNRSGRCVA